MLNALKLKIATKLYFIDNGKYPEALEELLPNYIEVIPKDVYTGEVTIYDYEAKKLDVKTPQGNLLYKINDSVYDLNFN